MAGSDLVEFEEAIRERAYAIWLAGGDGAEANWLVAEHEILIGLMEAAAWVMINDINVEQPRALKKRRLPRVS